MKAMQSKAMFKNTVLTCGFSQTWRKKFVLNTTTDASATQTKRLFRAITYKHHGDNHCMIRVFVPIYAYGPDVLGTLFLSL